MLSKPRNIIVIADEAHRSQYDLIDGLARNLRDSLPNASFIGFTGTPIEKTKPSKPSANMIGRRPHFYRGNYQSVMPGQPRFWTRWKLRVLLVRVRAPNRVTS